MNPKDPCTYFDQWLTAYSDRLHMVRQGKQIDLVSPQDGKTPAQATSNDTMTVQTPKPTSV